MHTLINHIRIVYSLIHVMTNHGSIRCSNVENTPSGRRALTIGHGNYVGVKTSLVLIVGEVYCAVRLKEALSKAMISVQS